MNHYLATSEAKNKPALLTVVEYFAGIGLVRMGLEEAGWKILFANDNSRKKFEMYAGFFPDRLQDYQIDNIFDLNSHRIPRAILGTCSFPCIDLSVAGNMNGIVVGNHSSAFWGFVKILAEQKQQAPPIILVENVPGWLTSNHGEDFKTAVRALNNLGYACDVFTLNALSFTPQSRLRVFLIGTKLQPARASRDLILSRPKLLLPSRLITSITSDDTLVWFYNQIPSPPPLKQHGLSDLVEKISPSDERWWSKNEVNRHLGMMAPLHRARIEYLAGGAEISYRTFFRRRRYGYTRAEVRTDDLAGCLRTAAGGSGKQFLIEAGRGRIRMRSMTAREYARLQGVPDHYEIKVNEIQALTGFGDAVCVPAIRWIAENILNPLSERVSI